MSDPQASLSERLLSEFAWLQRFALALTADPDRAEDLRQETLARALGAGQRVRASGSLRPWLSVVARRLDLGRRRQESRRQQREERAARAEAVPSAADSVAEFAVHKAVVDAVTALHEPYRSAVVLRFWEDLPPREVARRTGVPVETARTRIRRGLAQLRDRLDREQGGRDAWAVPLLAWRARTLAGAGTAAAGALGLGMVMTMKSKLLAGGALLAAGACLTLWGSGVLETVPETAPPILTAEAPDSARMPTTPSEPDPGVARASGEDALRRDALGPKAAEEKPAAGGSAILRGRCVEAQGGAPLAECRVELWGAPANEGNRPGEEDLGDVLAWTTDASGLFSFELPESGSQRWEILLTAEGRIPMGGAWDSIAGGSTLDLGDVPFDTGCRVHGTLTDAKGLPHADVKLGTWSRNLGRMLESPDVVVGGLHEATTAADGSFELSGHVPVGEYVIFADGLPPGVELAEIVFEVPDGHGSKRLDLRTRGDARDVIHGTVVGAPEGGFDFPLPLIQYGWRTFQVEGDGSFTIGRQRGDPEDGLDLLLWRLGNDRREVNGVPWGTDDLEISLPEGANCVLQVTDAESGQPLERFMVAVIAPTRNLIINSVPPRRHEGGRFDLGLRRGRQWLRVEPEDNERWFGSGWLTVVGGIHRSLAVPLPRRGERRLELRDGAGEPVANARVRLARPVSGERLQSEPLRGVEGVEPVNFAGDRLLASFRSDRAGQVVVTGPIGWPLALRIDGAGVVPLDVAPFALDADDPLVVTLQTGAALTVQTSADAAALLGQRSLHFRLRPVSGDGAQEVLDRQSEPGRHRFDGAPAGDYWLELHVQTRNGSEGRDYAWRALQRVYGLALGEDRELAVDLSSLQMARLDAPVQVDGRALGSTEVVVEGDVVDAAGRSLAVRAVQQTDAEGRLALDLTPGSYRVIWGERRSALIHLLAGGRHGAPVRID